MADAAKNIDDVYPPVPRPDDTWWMVRSAISGGSTTLYAFTPLSVKQHPNKEKAEQYVKDKIAVAKPSEVKIIGGPFSNNEAFMWTTLNPYVMEDNTSVAKDEDYPKKGNNNDDEDQKVPDGCFRNEDGTISC